MSSGSDGKPGENTSTGLKLEVSADLKLGNRSLLGEIWDFLRVRKKFWLAPIILALLLLGALIIFAGSAGVVSPFVYMM